MVLVLLLTPDTTTAARRPFPCPVQGTASLVPQSRRPARPWAVQVTSRSPPASRHCQQVAAPSRKHARGADVWDVQSDRQTSSAAPAAAAPFPPAGWVDRAGACAMFG